MKTIEQKLINEIEQLIFHAEEDSLSYSVLEHARKLVFEIKNIHKEIAHLESLLESESETLRLRTIERDVANEEILRLRGEDFTHEKLGEMNHLKERETER